MYFTVFLNQLRTTSHGFMDISFGPNSTGWANLHGLIIALYRHVNTFLSLMKISNPINPSFPMFNLA